jgi:hypothetical protein
MPDFLVVDPLRRTPVSPGAPGSGPILIALLILTGCDNHVPPAAIAPEVRSAPVSAPRELPIKPPVLPELNGVLFVDTAEARGLRYAWPFQPRPMRALEAFGCGCAAFDGDNDGWQDVLLVGSPWPVATPTRSASFDVALFLSAKVRFSWQIQ